MFPIQVIAVIKYGFLGLVVTGAGFLIANTAVPIHYKIEALQDISYKARVSIWNDSSILDRNFMKCLTEPSKPFCRIPKNRRLKLLRNQHHVSHASERLQKEIPEYRQPSQVYKLMFDFLSHANSLGVRPFLLETSILFCVLSAYQKYNVISNGLNVNILNGSSNEVTFGVFKKDSRILSNENSTKTYLESGYEFSSQMQAKNKTGDMNTCFFYNRHNLTLRVIVLFERGSFLWHPGSPNTQKPRPGHFSEASCFENFTPVSLQLENEMETGFYLPSELNRFLLQIQRSKFEECSTTSDMLSPHPTLSLEQLYLRVSIVIQELKSALRSHVETFWIWKETLSGWIKNCNIFEYTSEFNVAISADILSKMNMNDSFAHNEYLQPLEYSPWEHQLIFGCHGLRINVFMIYEDSRSIWEYEKNSTENWIKNSYLKFDLCSIEIMGLLVHKPCGKFLRRL